MPKKSKESYFNDAYTGVYAIPLACGLVSLVWKGLIAGSVFAIVSCPSPLVEPFNKLLIL